MANSAYGTPLIIAPGGSPAKMARVSLSATGEGGQYDEAFIQQLAFDHPNCLPVSEIDVAYEGLVPVCMELSTPAGPMDALYVTPAGRLVILEAKLWRNPEARRKVVAQILDYAKELSNWSYEDLQREVSRKLGRKGNALFELVKAHCPETDEIGFVDGVQQSLSLGRFLLLIVGDGIKEGAGAIADFLETVGRLEFTFGLVELALYQHHDVGLLVQPRVIARTVEFRRNIVVLPEGASLETTTEDELSLPEGQEEIRRCYREFWTDFLGQLRLDDVSQPMPNITQSQNLYFMLPPAGGAVWVSPYFSKSKETVGVYLKLMKGNTGDSASEFLLQDIDQIATELGEEVSLNEIDGRLAPMVTKRFGDVQSSSNRAEIKEFFADYLNRFINTFRHRLKRFAETNS
ncbi:MAG: DUF4268 domain-containing protein [Gammaproteobacteria bacterium]|nr:DUF4268 domain-containing protein [Gammaproteobacteria bacterium]